MSDTETKNDAPVENGETTETPVIEVPVATLEKVDKPNDAEYKRARGKIEGEIKRHQNHLQSIREKLDAESEARKSGSDERSGVISKLQSINGTLKGLFAKNKALRGELDAANNKKKSLIDHFKGQRKNLRFNSEAEVDDAIKAVEQRIKTEQLSLKEEKDLIAEISNLRGSKRVIGSYMQQKQAIDDEDAKGKAILTQIKANSAEIDRVRVEESKEKAQLDAIKAKTGERQAPKLIKERDEVRKLVNKLYAEKKKLYEDNEKKWSAFKAYEKEQRKIRDAQRAKDRAENKEVAPASDDEDEDEDDKPNLHPWADEMYTCDQLLTYLNGLLPKAEAVANNGPAEVAAPDGAKVIGKKHQEESGFMSGLQKKKGKKGKKAKKTGADEGALNHTLDIISSFGEFGITLPSNRSNVADAITAVEAKKAEFKEKTQADKDAANKAKTAKQDKPKREAKQVAPEYVAPSPTQSQALAGAWASRAAVAK